MVRLLQLAVLQNSNQNGTLNMVKSEWGCSAPVMTHNSATVNPFMCHSVLQYAMSSISCRMILCVLQMQSSNSSLLECTAYTCTTLTVLQGSAYWHLRGGISCRRWATTFYLLNYASMQLSSSQQQQCLYRLTIHSQLLLCVAIAYIHAMCIQQSNLSNWSPVIWVLCAVDRERTGQ